MQQPRPHDMALDSRWCQMVEDKAFSYQPAPFEFTVTITAQQVA